MFLHLGNNVIVSVQSCVGIFNSETLLKSDENVWLTKQLSIDSKSVVIDVKNNILSSKVSSYTIIQRGASSTDVLENKS